MKKLTKKQKDRLKAAGKWGGLGLLGYELYIAMVIGRQRTRDVFNLALQRKTATGKPLVVVGDPDGYVLTRVLGRDYDCADVCIDPRGCAKCANAKTATLVDGLTGMGAGSAVVFVAPGVLENEKDVGAALKAIDRVAGHDVFIAPAPLWSIRTLFRKHWITSAPPTTNGFTEWRDHPFLPGPSELRRLP